MRIATRLLLIGAVWLLVAAGIWRMKDADFTPGFAVEKASLSLVGEAPYFQEEFINPKQHLPMVHVASLAKLPDGRLGAVWYGGTGECENDVRIYCATRDVQTGWSEPRVVMTRTQVERDLGRPVKSLGNAVLLANPDGSLRLLFVSIAMGKWSGSQLNTCTSRDGGVTWSRAERLILSPFFNFSELVRNRPVSLVGGGWCVPVYQEFLGKFPELLWLKEQDGKLIARKTRIAGGCSTFQPSLVPLDAMRALALLRDYTDARRLFLSRTEDGGLSWSRPEPTNLPNPDAGISGLRLANGTLLVAFNDSTANRENLSLALSGDMGRTWKRIAVLENEPSSSFSYPYLMRSPDGLIRMAYTWKSKQIKMASFNEAWIAAQEMKK